jgi:hypothetical protein
MSSKHHSKASNEESNISTVNASSSSLSSQHTNQSTEQQFNDNEVFQYNYVKEEDADALFPTLKNLENERELFHIIKDIQKIVMENGNLLDDKQKWDYCKSQRYFIKQFLKQVNRR